MKRLRVLSFITVIVMIMSLIPCVMAADENYTIPFTVKEQNGVAVKDYFFRRGIPIEKGALHSVDTLCVMENGEPIVSDVEVTSRHLDGSISWILVSAKVDLKPNELKKLEVAPGTPKKGKITIKENKGNITVKSPVMEFVVGLDGVTSLKYKGVEQLTTGNINVFAMFSNNPETYRLKATDISVLKHTDSYVRIKLKGNVGPELDGEMIVTLVEDSEKIEIEHRVISMHNVYLFSTGIEIGSKYPGDKAADTIVASDCLDMGPMNFISYDNTRFRGGASAADATGYLICENSVKHIPIVHNREFLYRDGVSRTAHLYISFSNDAKEWDKTYELLPDVGISPEQYVKAGFIRNYETGAVVDDAIESFKFAYSKRLGTFDCGTIPRVINSRTKVIDGADSCAGEVGYNVGLAYMYTGDDELYRFVDECVEERADIVVYKGRYPEIYGAQRTRMGSFSHDAAFKEHPYYGDQGALFLGYMLTGNEFVGEMYDASIQHDIEYMYNKETCGGYVPQAWAWFSSPDNHPRYLEYQEIRGAIRIRSMYQAYLHYHDKKYLQAARDMILGYANTQWPDGSFIQATYDDGRPFTQEGQVQYPNKDYISLYGLRGMAQVLEFDPNETLARETVLKYADYLCYSNETFGQGLWYPNGDVNVYATNENDTRGKSPMTDILAVDIMATAFEITNNERYLENMCSLLESFLCGSTNGLAFWYTPLEGTPWVVGEEVDATRCSSIFKSSDNISAIVSENRQKIIDMGYENISVVFTGDAFKCEEAKLEKYKWPEVTQCTYQAGDTKAFFAANNYAPDTLDYEKYLKFTFDENRLWEGEKNIVNNPYSVNVEKFTKQYDFVMAVQRPIYVDEIVGEAEIYVNAYDEEKIEVEYKGDCELGLRFESGRFEIKDGEKYSVTVDGGKIGRKVTITKGGNISPVNGSLYVKLDRHGKKLDVVGKSALEGTGVSGNLDTALTSQQLEKVVKDVLNQEIDLKSEKPTWNEFAPEIIGAFKNSGNDVFEMAGMTTAIAVKPEENISDEEAVKRAANTINIEYEGDELCSDLLLAKETIHGCKVEWTSSNENVLTTDGLLIRNNIDCDKITLTAKISKNDASVVKTFEIPIKQKEPISHWSSADILKTGFPLIRQDETCEVTFTCIPHQNNIDGIMVLGDSSYPATSLRYTPYMIRMNMDGYIDCVNYYWTEYKNKVYYEAGKKYTFRVVVHIADGTYDCWVTPEGTDKEILLAEGFTPRYTAPLPKKIDIMWLWTSSFQTYEIVDCSLYEYKKLEPKMINLFDENNLMFGKYNTTGNVVIPDLSDSGNLMNWTKAVSSVKENGGSVEVYIGEESKKTEEFTIIEALKQARIMDRTKTGSDKVTASDIARIINVLNTIEVAE